MTLKLIPHVVAITAFGALAFAQGNHEATKEYKAAHEKMMQSMMAPMSGDPDQDFAMMMIPHHQGAIDMAQIELRSGKDPMLVEMAKKIIEAQEKEIEQLKKWQAEHAM